jgi:hypothetical protein
VLWPKAAVVNVVVKRRGSNRVGEASVMLVERREQAIGLDAGQPATEEPASQGRRALAGLRFSIRDLMLIMQL